MSSEENSSEYTQQQDYFEAQFINNIGQSISDSQADQLFANWDVEKIRFAQSQSYQLTKIIDSANKVQKNLTDHINNNIKTDKNLIEFYEFACQVFKEIGLLKETYDDSLSRISTVFKTVKRNYEKTKVSVNNQSQPSYYNFDFPAIPKILQMRQYEESQCPSIQAFNSEPIQNYQELFPFKQIQLDFRDIEMQIFKRIRFCQDSSQKKLDFKLQTEQNLLKSYYLNQARLSEQKRSHEKQYFKEVDMQAFKIQGKNASIIQHNKSYLSSENSYTEMRLSSNISGMSNQFVFDDLIYRILQKKNEIKRNN